MKKIFYTAFFWLLVLFNLNAQVYPYTDDFQSVNGVGTSCFGDCSNTSTYLSGQGWTGADIGKWKVNDAYGNSTATPAKGLGTNRFSVGTGITTLEIITPSIGDITSASVLKFDYKMVTGASFNQPYTLAAGEEVKIQISVNGGSFTDIHTFTNANHTATASMTAFLTGISSFDNPDPANENVKFKFIYKRNDTGNNPVWIFTMDNIKVEDGGTDAGVIALVTPTSGCGFTASTPITFKVKNYGGASISNVPVQVSVTNGTTTNYNAVVTGPIASGTESTTQTVNVDMSAIGVYTVFVQTQLVGDTNSSNDTTSKNTTNIAPKIINATTTYSTSFETGDASVALWTIIDGAEAVSSTSRKWQTNTNLASNGTTSMYYGSFNQTVVADDWLITPCLQLQTGKTYEVSYKVAVKSAGGAAYGVKLGNSTSTGSFTTSLYTTPASYSTPLDINSNATFVTQRHTFTVSSNGIYYLAWHATSGVPIFSDEINVDQVLIKELKTTDAELVSFDSPLQNTTNCYSATEDVKVTVRNSGSASLSNIQVTVNVTGPVTQTLNQTITSLASGQSQQVTLGQVNMTTQGTYVFAPSISVTGDEDTSNNTVSNVSVNGGASSTPVTSVNFTGYTGTTSNLNSTFTGWYEKRNDASYPTPGDGAGSYWAQTSRFNATNGTNAVINLFSDATPNPDFHKNDMIVSPLILMGSGGSLTFKVALTDYTTTAADNMGSDDSFKVVVLTNCGATQTTLLTISIANNNVPDNTLNDNTRTVDLSAYNGQIIQIAFVGSTGTVLDTQDYDFHLDDINITGAVIGAFTVNLGADQSVCSTGFPIVLDAGVTGATTYAWTRNGSPIGGNTQTLSVTQAGTYAISVTKNSVTKTDEVIISQKPNATASFTSAINNLQVTFTNTSTDASSYTWNFGDGGTSTDVNPTYTYANAGTYTVTLTATSLQGCANGSTTASVTVAPLAIEDEQNRYIEVYPNPNTGVFVVRLKEYTSSNNHIEIRDLLGKVVWRKENVNQEESLSLKMVQGIYILAIQTEEKVITKRIQIIK
jgi:hypothetical protein